MPGQMWKSQSNRTEQFKKCVKIFQFQTQQLQIFAVSHSDNPIPDKNNEQSTSRKHVNENHLELKAPQIFVLVSVSNGYTHQNSSTP